MYKMALLASACKLWGVITEYRLAKNGIMAAYCVKPLKLS